MKPPTFFAKIDQERFEVELVEFDLESHMHILGLEVHSWGRVNTDKLKKKFTVKFEDDNQAAEILRMLISENAMAGPVLIAWSNADIYSIRSSVSLLLNYADDVLCEDWDCWIFFGSEWVIEKYHEGEIVLLHLS